MIHQGGGNKWVTFPAPALERGPHFSLWYILLYNQGSGFWRLQGPKEQLGALGAPGAPAACIVKTLISFLSCGGNCDPLTQELCEGRPHSQATGTC